mmetsp:Transcript_8320/g.10372  ORF Transcript_8320/g.10372 Transcript_8320/m.10372 type:complete len:569 (+) Transcript_8320:35-1741(+)
MAKKKKSNATNAARLLESSVSPIVEIKYPEPLFTVAAHPTKPILLSGLATGHIYCSSYDADKLEESQSMKREKLSLLEKEAFKTGKIANINKSVSQLKQKWWTVIEDNTEIPDGLHIVNNWKTKRHKGSCRSAIFDPLENSLGENIYSVGTDHIIKKANTETGKVLSKATISDHYSENKDAITKLAHSTSHPFLLSGTENGDVLVYDSNNMTSNQLKFKVSKAHDDSINHILPMPSVSAYHYLTLGSTTLSHIDIRKGIITQSDDQEDELLSMCFASDHVNDNKNDTVLVSHGEGIVTIWKNSKNRLMDQLSRIKVNKDASIDAIIPTMNCDDGEMVDSVWCGDSEGLLHRINYKKGKVVETRVHSSAGGKYGAADEVGILDIDYDYRLISAGMDSLKIWSNQEEVLNSDTDDSDSDIDSDDSDSDENDRDEISPNEDSDSDVSDDSDNDNINDSLQEKLLGLADSDSNDIENDSDEEQVNGEEQKKPLQIVRKKRFNVPEIYNKTNINKKVIDINKLTKEQSTKEDHDEEAEEPNKKKQKLKAKQMSTKQIRNMQKHEHGIRRFDDL